MPEGESIEFKTHDTSANDAASQAQAMNQLHRGVAVHVGFSRAPGFAALRKRRGVASQRRVSGPSVGTSRTHEVTAGEATMDEDREMDKGTIVETAEASIRAEEKGGRSDTEYAQKKTKDWKYYHSARSKRNQDSESEENVVQDRLHEQSKKPRPKQGIPTDEQAEALSNFANVIMSPKAAYPAALKWCQLRGIPSSQAPSVVTVARHLRELSLQSNSSRRNFASSEAEWTELLNKTFQPECTDTN